MKNTSVEKKLLRIENRRYRASVLSGVFFAVSVCFWIPSVYLTLDATLFRTSSTGVRIVASTVCFLIMVATFFLTVVRTIRNKPSLFDTAKTIHLRHVHSDGDLYTSTVDFLAKCEPGTSEAMRDFAIQQAAHELTAMKDDCLVNRYVFYWTQTLVAVTCTFFVVISICLPMYIKTAVNIFLVPWGDAAWPKHHLFVIEDPVWTVVRGHSWQVVLMDRNGKKLPKDVQLIGYYQKERSDQTDNIITMNRSNMTPERIHIDKKMDVFQRKCQWNMENVRASFSFWVTGGDERIGPFSVQVVDPVLVEDAHMYIKPPEYTNTTEYEQKNTGDVPEGSHVKLHIRWSRPIRSAFLEYTKKGAVPSAFVHLPSTTATSETTANSKYTSESDFDFGVLDTPKDFSYILYYETVEHAIGQTHELYMNIRPDKTPRFLQTSPPDAIHELFLPWNSKPTFSITAEDDYGVEKAYFEWFCEGLQDEPQRIEMEQVNVSPSYFTEDKNVDARPNAKWAGSEWQCEVDFNHLMQPDTKMIAWKFVLEDGKRQTIESPSRWVIVVPTEYFYKYIGYEARRIANRLIQASIRLDQYAATLEQVEETFAKDVMSDDMDEHLLRNAQSQYVTIKKSLSDPSYITLPDMRAFFFYIAALPNKKNVFVQWVDQWSSFFREQPHIFHELNESCDENLLFLELAMTPEPTSETIPETLDSEKISSQVVQGTHSIRQKNLILLDKIKKLSLEYQNAATQMVSFDQYEKNRETLKQICKMYQTLDAQMRKNAKNAHTSLEFNQASVESSPLSENNDNFYTSKNLILALQNIQNDFLQWQGDLLDFTHNQQISSLLKVGQDQNRSAKECVFVHGASIDRRWNEIRQHINLDRENCILDISSQNLALLAEIQSRFHRKNSDINDLEWLKVLRMDVIEELHSNKVGEQKNHSVEYLRRLNWYDQQIATTQKTSPCTMNVLRSCVELLYGSDEYNTNIVYCDSFQKYRMACLLSSIDQIIWNHSRPIYQMDVSNSQKFTDTKDSENLSLERRMLVTLQWMVDSDTIASKTQKSLMQQRVLEQLISQFPWMDTSESDVYLAHPSSLWMIENIDQTSEHSIPNIPPDVMTTARSLPWRMRNNMEQIEFKIETCSPKFQWPRRLCDRKNGCGFSSWNQFPNDTHSMASELELVLTAIALTENDVQKNMIVNVSTNPNSEQNSDAVATDHATPTPSELTEPETDTSISELSSSPQASNNTTSPHEQIASTSKTSHHSIPSPDEQDFSTPSASDSNGGNSSGETSHDGNSGQGTDAGMPQTLGNNGMRNELPSAFVHDTSSLVEQIWGELPARASSVLRTRRSMESFHPLYQRETEAFFRQLLEQRQTDSANENVR